VLETLGIVSTIVSSKGKKKKPTVEESEDEDGKQELHVTFSSMCVLWS
jgi:hypothetical protein